MKIPAHYRYKRLRRLPLLSPRLWLRRIAFWIGAILVAVVAMGFAQLADMAFTLLNRVEGPHPILIFLLAPAGLALAVSLTRTVFPNAQGSGIPQVIASMHMVDEDAIDKLLSIRVALGKMVLTILGIASGASIGREGPTAQISAAIMRLVGKTLRVPRLETHRALILAGGAAGVAAAFNTPLAGVVFAIEELSHSFESRTSGVVLTAVIVAGVTTLALVGNYPYFGVSSVTLNWGRGWILVALCAIICGMTGGLFSQALLTLTRKWPGRVGAWITANPVVFAACCGFMLAVLAMISDGATLGTGYAQARGLIEGTSTPPRYYFVMRMAATMISYLSGVPGGIFAPSLSTGAAMGGWIGGFVSGTPVAAAVLLGMVAYFSGVVQAPITAFVIVMEITRAPQMTIPLMATAMLSCAVSKIFCRRPLYSALARRFLGPDHA